MAKPYFKKSHKAWYANIDGKTVKLGRTEAEAFAEYARRLDPAAPEAASQAPAASISPATPGVTAPAPVAGPTLAEIVTRWRAHLKASANEGTYKSYERYARRWAAIHGSKPAASIIGADVTEAKDKLYPRVNDDPNLNGGKPYSGTCRRQHIKAAKQLFVWAKEQGIIKANPIEDYRSKSKFDRYGKRDVDLSRDQFDRLFAACDDELFRQVLIVLWDIGCRPAEAFNATAKHLDRKNRCLRYAAGEAKGNKARIVYLTDRAFDILSRLADQHPDGPLLRNRIGRKWSVGSADARLTVLDARTGVKATSYVFRHAFCSRHVRAGTNLVKLQNLMGHSSLKMISEVYAHIGGDSADLRAALSAA
jgi:integrase